MAVVIENPLQEVKTFPIVFKSPTSILPYYQNAKRHTRRQVVLLAKAIKTVGFDQPIVVDKDMVIIKGHGRRLAALELKMDLVPVVIRDDLTPVEVMASRLADNQTHSRSQVDPGREQEAIQKYVEMGGSDAPIFFDFMNPELQNSVQLPAASAKVKPNAGPTVSGAMQACPRCQHSFLEVK